MAAYFGMLQLELSGVAYNKSEHNRLLRQLLDDRSHGAVEYKLQNISAILVNHGLAYIRGYLPAQNYQQALESAVLEWLEVHGDVVRMLERSPILNPSAPGPLLSFDDLLTEPPEPLRAPRAPSRPVPLRVDFLRLDAENRLVRLRS
ncbi:MAG: hypothetical protein KGN76_10020 [Acidobacteriota bacterium]|nr:hypothetical protein [Acidobacteriota bacterium]